MYVRMLTCVWVQVCECLQLCVCGGRTSQPNLKLSHKAGLLGSWLRKSTVSTFLGMLCHLHGSGIQIWVLVLACRALYQLRTHLCFQ